MLTISVCIGSSCHMKGSYEVISRFQTLIRQRELQDVVDLKGAFCMEHCTGDVAVRIDDGPVISVTRADVDEVFNRQVLPRVGVK